MKWFSSAWLVMAISAVALLGWVTGNHDPLARLLPPIANMTFNTALCFLLLASGCVALARAERRPWARWFAIAVGLFALLSLVEGVFGVDLGVDNLLFDSRHAGAHGQFSGRMSPLTAAGFVLASGVLLALSAGEVWRKLAVWAHGLLVMVALIGVMGVLMNLLLTDVPRERALFASISLFTAVDFLLLASALMRRFCARGVEGSGECGWLYSSKQLMYRLNYPEKFALISLLFLVPMAVMLWNEVEEADEHVAQARLEMEGLSHVRMTGRLLRAFAEHRGMRNGSFADPTLFRKGLADKEAEIDRLLAENGRMDREQAGAIAIPKGWNGIAKRWQTIKNGRLNRAQQWRLHTEIIAMLVRHMRTIGDETGLLREQDLLLHHLIVAPLLMTPPLLESVGQMRGLGVAMIASGKVTDEDRLKLGGLLGRLAWQRQDLDSELRLPFAEVGMEALIWPYQEFSRRLHGLTTLTKERLLSGHDGGISPRDYFAQATGVIRGGSLFDAAVLRFVGRRLHRRVDRELRMQYNIKLAVLLLVIVLLLLFTAFYRSVLDTIQALALCAQRMRHGELGQASIPTHDELSRVVSAFNSVADELMQVSSRMRAVVDHAANGIVIIDSAGVVQTFNPAAEAIFGYAAGEVIGHDVTMLMPEGLRESHRAGLTRCVATGEGRMMGSAIKVEGLKKNGERFPLELVMAPMEYDGAQWFIGMVRDISEQQLMEEQLRHAQKMEAVGSLVGGVAHNFNNMLAGIVGKAYLAKMKAKDDPRVVRDLEAIEDVTRQAGDMVSQLLLFAQKDFMRAEQDVALAPLLRRTLDGLEPPEGVELALTVADEDLVVHCDASQMQRVVVALVENGFDAVSGAEDKRVVVSLARVVPEAAFLQQHPELGEPRALACITVEDHGCGIEEEVLPRIFEPFFTTKEVGEGAGLGLSSAFGTIATHHGVIEVESEVGKGSRFKVYLPLVG